jgi:hypothetical protein
LIRHRLRAGTALVLAFLQVAALMPVAELAQRKSAAKAHFADFVARFLALGRQCCRLLTARRLTRMYFLLRASAAAADARGLGLWQDADGLRGTFACVRVPVVCRRPKSSSLWDSD